MAKHASRCSDCGYSPIGPYIQRCPNCAAPVSRGAEDESAISQDVRHVAPEINSPPPQALGMKMLREMIILLPALVLIYFGIRQMGPWQWLAELQLALIGMYFAGITATLLLALAAAPYLFLNVVLNYASWRGRPLLWNGLAYLLAQWAHMPAWLSFPMALGFLAFIFGFCTYIPANLLGSRLVVDAAVLEAGERPENRWVVIRGSPLVARAVVWKENGRTVECNWGMVSSKWKPGNPVAVVLSASREESLFRARENSQVEGVVSILREVPGLIRSSLEKKGLVIADNAVYVEAGNPHKGLEFALYAGISGGVVFLLTLLANLARVHWFGPGTTGESNSHVASPVN